MRQKIFVDAPLCQEISNYVNSFTSDVSRTVATYKMEFTKKSVIGWKLVAKYFYVVCLWTGCPIKKIHMRAFALKWPPTFLFILHSHFNGLPTPKCERNNWMPLFREGFKFPSLSIILMIYSKFRTIQTIHVHKKMSVVSYLIENLKRKLRAKTERYRFCFI